MNKLAVGPGAKGKIDIERPITENLKAIAKAKHKDVEDLTTIVLDRDRHIDVIAEIRKAGARIRLIPDGDVAAALMTAWPMRPLQPVTRRWRSLIGKAVDLAEVGDSRNRRLAAGSGPADGFRKRQGATLARSRVSAKAFPMSAKVLAEPR